MERKDGSEVGLLVDVNVDVEMRAPGVDVGGGSKRGSEEEGGEGGGEEDGAERDKAGDAEEEGGDVEDA